MTLYKIYKLVCDDGHYYYGSTKRQLRQRLYLHTSKSKCLPDMKLYKHINQIGWEKVRMEEVESFEGDRKTSLLRENHYINNNLADPLCLNSHCSGLTTEEKKQHHSIALKKYQASHREQINQKCRDYYYKRKYNKTEAEHKSNE